MAENQTPEQPAENIPAADPVDATTEAETAPATQAHVPITAAPQQRLRERLFSFRAVVAVAVATLLLGGAGGAALVAVTDDGQDDGPRIAQRGDGPGGYGDRDRQFRDGPGGGPGFAPPQLRQEGSRSAPETGEQPESGSAS